MLHLPVTFKSNDDFCRSPIATKNGKVFLKLGSGGRDSRSTTSEKCLSLNHLAANLSNDIQRIPVSRSGGNRPSLERLAKFGWERKKTFR